jgi:oxygen-independent coproporphyrinogen-3 oxidase
MHEEPVLVSLASRRVPRYTSYPTAVQFSADIGADVYRAWLADIEPDMKLSAYLHVPFCQRLCYYCGCHTRAERNGGVLAAYAETLSREVELIAGMLPRRMALSRLHWGGGTPTELGGPGLAQVLNSLRETFDFDEGLEHAIEIDPRRVDGALVRTLARLGVNRVSFGVQTFDPLVQSAIGRVQTFEQVLATVEWFREEGVEAIGFDLMYGLPHQNVCSVLRTVEKALRLAPRRISAFGYAHVPWKKKVQGGIAVEALPPPEERLGQLSAMRGALMASGYEPVGFDHFALPVDSLAQCTKRGKLRRNFQGYTDDAAQCLIGLGASSIGRLPAGYIQNTADVQGYMAAVSERRPATSRGRNLTPEDRQRSALIQDVLCNGRVRLDDTVSAAIRQSVEPRIAQFAGQGLVESSGSDLRITERGWPFARLIASIFDAYDANGGAGYSLAV